MSVLVLAGMYRTSRIRVGLCHTRTHPVVCVCTCLFWMWWLALALNERCAKEDGEPDQVGRTPSSLRWFLIFVGHMYALFGLRARPLRRLRDPGVTSDWQRPLVAPLELARLDCAENCDDPADRSWSRLISIALSAASSPFAAGLSSWSRPARSRHVRRSREGVCRRASR